MLRNWMIFDKLPTEQLIRVKRIHVFEGGRSALYITSGDIVYGVGANGNYNLLGLSGRQRHFSLVLEPVSVERLSLKAINTIAVGDFFGIANNSNGELYHWGRRMDKRRGILLPHLVKCPYFVTDIACGSEFFVVLTKERKVFFRGTFQQNDHPILEFTEVSVGFRVSSVSCGIYHAAMLSTEGEVFNCGYDHHTSYRTWKAEEGLNPKKLELREHCVQVVCGRRSTVCLLSSGSVWACGENDNLGVDSDNSVMKNPAKIMISEPIKELAATWFSNVFAACAWNGRIYCWGNKTRWPKVVPDACVLLDAFKNKETPSSLGIVPVAPQLSPCSSFSDRTPMRRPAVTPLHYDVAKRLERSMSADDLTSHYPTVIAVSDDGNNYKENNQPQYANKPPSPHTSKSNKNLPPGLGLLISAGKYLATRPSDRQTNEVPVPRRRALSPDPGPTKSSKSRFSVVNETTVSTEDMVRSQSMEDLDAPPSPPSKKKPRVLSMIFGRNPFDVSRRTPLVSPENETPPQFYLEQPISADLDQPSAPSQANLEPSKPKLESSEKPVTPPQIEEPKRKLANSETPSPTKSKLVDSDLRTLAKSKESDTPTVPKSKSTEPATKIISTNPFLNSNHTSLYPEVPLPVRNGRAEYYFSSSTRNPNETNLSKKDISKSNPFLYDPLSKIKFEFHKDGADCYSQRKNSSPKPQTDSEPKNYNPGSKALLKYYCVLADIKTDVVELQRMVNELADLLSDL